MAKQFTVTKNDGSTKDIKYTAKASKYARLNYMTIPQIKTAKAILQKKIDSKQVDASLQYKLIDLQNQYEKTEREINKFYQKFATDPRTKHLIAGQKNALTIARINQKDYPNKRGGKKEGLKYGAKDMILGAMSSKFALGVGIAAMSLGVAGQLTSAVFGKSLTELLKILIDMMWKNNPAALIAIGTGAALIIANKAIPAVRNKIHNVQRKKLQMNQVQNELTGEHEKEIDQFDADLLHENKFGGNTGDKKNKDILINSLYNNPETVLASLGMKVPESGKIQHTEEIEHVIAEIKKNQNLTPTQKSNLIEVVKGVAKKSNDASEHEKVEETVKEEAQEDPTAPKKEGEDPNAPKKEGEDPEKQGPEGAEKPDPQVAGVGMELFEIMAELENYKGIVPQNEAGLIEAIKTVRPEMDPTEAERIAKQIAEGRAAAAARNASKGVQRQGKAASSERSNG